MRAFTFHTIESLRARCEPEGDCLIWRGPMNGRTPQTFHGGAHISVRKLVALLEGRTIKEGAIFGVRCGVIDCVCSEHIVQRNRSTHARVMSAAAAKRGAARNLKVTAERRQRANVKMDLEKAREIRESEERSDVLAQRFGISKEMVNAIRRGRYWRDYSSPFAGLGAR